MLINLCSKFYRGFKSLAHVYDAAVKSNILSVESCQYCNQKLTCATIVEAVGEQIMAQATPAAYTSSIGEEGLLGHRAFESIDT